jgi:hypothetical protein
MIIIKTVIFQWQGKQSFRTAALGETNFTPRSDAPVNTAGEAIDKIHGAITTLVIGR